MFSTITFVKKILNIRLYSKWVNKQIYYLFGYTICVLVFIFSKQASRAARIRTNICFSFWVHPANIRFYYFKLWCHSRNCLKLLFLVVHCDLLLRTVKSIIKLIYILLEDNKIDIGTLKTQKSFKVDVFHTPRRHV